MRKFIEIIREQTEEQTANGEPLEQIRVEVGDETGPEILDQIAALRAGVGWTAAESVARLHLCRHDDTPPAPCVLVPESEIA